MKFEEMELDDRLVAACIDAGYEKPTNVQLEVIPEALDGMDILADAPTGTGKTAAFLLPCMQHLLDFPGKRQGLARILILTPTRELALQIGEHAERLAKYIPEIKIGTIIGGVQHEEQLPVISEKTDIVIATPGRLIEYLRKKAFDIRGVEILVLDEADRMLDMGFIDDVAEISEAAERREQTMLFSATLEGALLERFANDVLEKPVEIHIDSPRSERKKIAQYKYYADDLEHKIKILEALLRDERFDKSIVFIKTRERLAELVKRLDADGFRFCYLRGEMDQDKRISSMQRFANNEVKIMLATDVAARGIDVADITHVINFDLPRTADIYVHRIGRTARAGRKGSAVSLIEAHDVPMLNRIEHYTGESIDMRVVDDLRPQNKIADFSKKKSKVEAKEEKTEELHRKERSRDKKNKGKPDFAAKLRAKMLKAGATEAEIEAALAKKEPLVNDEHRAQKKEASRTRKEKAAATAEVLAEISARRGRDVIPPEKVAAQQAALLSSGKKNPPDVIIEDDGEDYYDDDDIEMIEERRFAEAEAKASRHGSSGNSTENNRNHKADNRRKGSRTERGHANHLGFKSDEERGAHGGKSFKRDSRFSLDEIEIESGEKPELEGRCSRALRFFDDGFGKDENYRDFGDGYEEEKRPRAYTRDRDDKGRRFGSNQGSNKGERNGRRDRDADGRTIGHRSANKNERSYGNRRGGSEGNDKREYRGRDSEKRSFGTAEGRANHSERRDSRNARNGFNKRDGYESRVGHDKRSHKPFGAGRPKREHDA